MFTVLLYKLPGVQLGKWIVKGEEYPEICSLFFILSPYEQLSAASRNMFTVLFIAMGKNRAFAGEEYALGVLS